MINNKKQYFWLFSLVVIIICMVNNLFCVFQQALSFILILSCQLKKDKEPVYKV